MQYNDRMGQILDGTMEHFPGMDQRSIQDADSNGLITDHPVFGIEINGQEMFLGQVSHPGKVEQGYLFGGSDKRMLLFLSLKAPMQFK